MFEYAKDHGYIASNPFPELKVTVKFRQVSKPTSETQVYNTDEYHNIIEDLWKSYDKKHEPRFLSIVCNFLMGLRVGELCALRWRDLDMKQWEISIVQEMVHMDSTELNNPYYDVYKTSGQIVILLGQGGRKGVYVLLDHTKTHTERVIPVVHKAQEIFKLLNENAPDAKPDDKLRKTYASRLNAAGLPLDQIRACLGHSNTTTTLWYIYNPLTPEESLNIMEKAFSN